VRGWRSARVQTCRQHDERVVALERRGDCFKLPRTEGWETETIQQHLLQSLWLYGAVGCRRGWTGLCARGRGRGQRPSRLHRGRSRPSTLVKAAGPLRQSDMRCLDAAGAAAGCGERAVRRRSPTDRNSSHIEAALHVTSKPKPPSIHSLCVHQLVLQLLKHRLRPSRRRLGPERVNGGLNHDKRALPVAQDRHHLQ
jgi:hypothetical protein